MHLYQFPLSKSVLFTLSSPTFASSLTNLPPIDTSRSTSLTLPHPPPLLSLLSLNPSPLRRPLEQIPQTLPLSPRLFILQLRSRNLSPRRGHLLSPMDPTVFQGDLERGIREFENGIVSRKVQGRK